MTEVPEGSGPIPRRTSRAVDGGAPVSGALAIALAVVALVAGFLILRSISGDEQRQLGVQPGEGSQTVDTGTDDPNAATVPPGGTVATSLPPVTAPPPLVTVGASVMVVNANFQGGTAGTMSRALESGPGFSMVSPSDAAGLDAALTTSLIYYDPDQVAAIDVANSLNRVLGGDLSVTVIPDPANPPVQSGTLSGAGVVLMLGLDKANKTLDELNPGASGTPAVVTNPPLTNTTAPAG
jgi:hypothetical protein